MKKYESYKKAKFNWISKIPSHWNEGKIKYLFDIGRGRVISQLELKVDGKYPVYSSQTKNDGCLGYIDTFDFEDNLLTWTTDGANAGEVFKRSGRFNCTNVCGTLKPTKEIDLKYYLYLLQFLTPFYKRPDTNGAKIINGEMAEISCFILPIKEQTQIANYLDHKTQIIDALIEKKEQLIRKLQAQRQAIINEAVTKGLNSNAEMKDSDIEWLGDIPEHWILKKLSHLNNSLVSGPFGSALKKEYYKKAGYKIYGQEQVIKDDFNFGDYYVSEEKFNELKRCEILENDILISCVGTFGKIALVPKEFEKGIINPRLLKLTPKTNIIQPKYFLELLRSELSFFQLEAMSRGGTMGVINLSILSRLKFPLPPINEQLEIIELIEKKKSVIDKVLKLNKSQIKKLKSYRQSIISEAVTGKIDVRDWQAPSKN